MDEKRVQNHIKDILLCIGDDPEREGLQRTPMRFARACTEWFGGYNKDPKEVLNRTFPAEGYNDICLIKNIEFNSFCEHHIAPIKGYAHIAYIPKDRILGLDKFVKLVEVFGRRLQTQEVMTQQIGEAIVDVLIPEGVYVLIEAKHDCIGSRETRNKTTVFTTTFRSGIFETNQHIEARVLKLIGFNIEKPGF